MSPTWIPDVPAGHENARPILRAAKTILRDRGWCRGLAQDFQGRVCLLGAVLIAGAERSHLADPWDGNNMDTAPGEVWAAIEALEGRLGTDRGGPTIDKWNDTTAKTVHDVITLLDETIATLRKGTPR